MTNGMIERFIGRIEDVLRSHRFRSGEEIGVVSREMVSELAFTCFFIAGVVRSLVRSLGGEHRRRFGIVAHGRQLFHRHVAAGDDPFVVLFQQ